MPFGDETFFKQEYGPIDKLASFINVPARDPDGSFHDYLARYGAWKKTSEENADAETLFFYFQGTADVRRALEAGAGGEGRVQKKHCADFSRFVSEGEAAFDALIEEIKAIDPDYDPDGRPPFDVAVHAFQLGVPLGGASDAALRGLLSGACFVYKQVEVAEVAGEEQQESPSMPVDGKWLDAIPGVEMLTTYRRDLSDPTWAGLLAQMQEAARVAGRDIINLDLALQLRLGGSYPPTSADIGKVPIVIFGAG